MRKIDTFARVGETDQFLDWYTKIRLLVAPESGLSVDAATGIARALASLRGSNSSVDLKVVQRLRLERLNVAGVSRAAEVLRTIDNDARATSHPWAQILGPPQAKDAPAKKPPRKHSAQ
jgi:hypothetical protein